jgi:hypothetical protein
MHGPEMVANLFDAVAVFASQLDYVCLITQASGSQF